MKSIPAALTTLLFTTTQTLQTVHAKKHDFATTIKSLATARNSNYTPEQCDQWVTAAISSDTVQSANGGLSQSEFMNFLSTIPQLSTYFNPNLITVTESSVLFATLPFEIQLAYPTLACWCEELGDGRGCCEGENNSRINVSRLVQDDPTEVEVAYRDDFCAFMALLVGELTKLPDGEDVTSTSSTMVVPVTTTSITTTTSSTVGTTTTTSEGGTTTTQPSSPTTEEVPFYFIGSVINYSNYLHNNIVPSIFDNGTPTTATDILEDSNSENGVLAQLIGGFTSLSVDMLQECPVGESGSILDPIVLGGLGETLVEDADCPEGLTYAPQNGSCIAFTVIVQPTEGLVQNDEIRTCLETNINTAINNGQLYNLIESIWGNDTKFTGIGKPGAGVDYIGQDTEISEEENSEDDGSITTEKDEASAIPDATSSKGITAGYLALIILALFALPLIVFAVVRHRQRQEEEMARVREFAGEPADDTELDLENPAIGDATAAASSSVAATAPSILVPVVTPKKQKDDDESSVPSVWSETRSSQIDVVEDDSAHIVNAKLGSSLAAMGMASSVATSLYEKKSDEEADQEGNVETSKMAVVPPLPLQQQEEKLDLASIKAEIQSLVEKTSPGKTTEELLTAYAGKEEELLSHLRRLYRETRG